MYSHKIIKILFVAALASAAAFSEAASLTKVNFAELPGERAELRLSFDSEAVLPHAYTIDQPARIVLDFADVENKLAQKKYPVEVGGVQSAVVLEGGGRTRVIVNLDRMELYSTALQGSDLVIEIGGDSAQSVTEVAVADVSAGGADPVVATPVSSSFQGVQNIDFRRGEAGEGKVIVELSDSKIAVDVQEVSGGIKILFTGAELPEPLRRKLDVVDFATPVTLLSSKSVSRGTELDIDINGEYDYLAYQADNQYVVSVKPLTAQQLEEKKRKFAYVGERLSLNFQDIEVRSVLQLIADFTEFNLVAADTVRGSITLRLDNVPWDQALDIVLKSKGLDKRLMGNVLMVAPAEEIAARERTEIETKKQLQELAPLRTEYIRIRYANAVELYSLFEDSSNGDGGNSEGSSNGNSTGSLLSSRGRAIVDERTNSIILTDTEEKIAEFKRLVETIDIPVRQVMIEARIVIANTDFKKELGFRISGDAAESSKNGSNKYELSGTLEGLVNADGSGPEALFIDGDGDGVTDDERDLTSSNIVDLGVFEPAGSLAWNVIGSNFLLGMELSALENSGFAEIVSQPKVITGDKQQASIENGTEIPYLEESASGGATIAFKEATLKLDVTPQITPDNKIIMDLKINQDSVGAIDSASGVPLIDITQLETQVLVADGETIVLGGIYQTEAVISETKIPLLGDIPFIGRLFRNNSNSEDKRELLLFITPRILSSDLNP